MVAAGRKAATTIASADKELTPNVALGILRRLSLVKSDHVAQTLQV